MKTKNLLPKIQRIKAQLRNLENNLKDLPRHNNTERALLGAACHAVIASQAELNSAIFSLETLADLTNKK
jgi:hypothetical protein